MTHRERLETLKNGGTLTRPAYAAWGHVMNLSDLNAADFARATIDYQKTHDFDFVKVMSNPYYMIEDMGLELMRPKDFLTPTARNSANLPIRRASDWQRVTFSEIGKGALKREADAIARICDYFHGDTPVLPSIFTPVTWLQYLSIPSDALQAAWKTTGSCAPALEAYLTKNEPLIRDAIDRFQELNLRYMEELLKLGADGFFYAVEYADDVWSSDDIYERFFKKYDLEALRSVKDRSFFTMLHACGDCGVRLDRIKDYPVDAVNWSDQSIKNPSLKEAASVLTQLPVGGIDHKSDMKGIDRDAIKARLTKRVRDALEATGGRVILAGGCVFDVADTYRFGLWREVLDEAEVGAL